MEITSVPPLVNGGTSTISHSPNPVPAAMETDVAPSAAVESPVTGMRDQLMENLFAIDNGYLRLFAQQGAEVSATGAVSGKWEKALDDALSGDAPLGMQLKAITSAITEMEHWGIGVMQWSTRLHLFASTVTSSAQGLNTLLKSGGG